jgi:hypothetical protein
VSVSVAEFAAIIIERTPRVCHATLSG